MTNQISPFANSPDQLPLITGVAPTRSGKISKMGLLALLAGTSLGVVEWGTEAISRRLGGISYWVVMICSAGIALWGITDMIAEAFPRFSSRSLVRNRFSLPVAGRIYLTITFVLFIGSLVGHSNPLMIVFSLMTANFLINGNLTYWMLRRIQVRRSVPARVMSGETFSVEVHLVNRRWLLGGWLITVRDAVTNAECSLSPEVMFIQSPAGAEVRGHYRVRLESIGRYDFGPVYVGTHFPWGLVERGIILEVPGTLIVYPRIGRLAPGWKRRLSAATELANQSVPRSGPFEDDFYRIREYRMGDDPRAIHWRTSARRNELMVKEYRENRDRSMLVLFDGYVPQSANLEERQRFFAGLSFVATLCLEHLRSNREARLGFLASGKAMFEWSGGAGEARLETLLDGLAQFESCHTSTLSALWKAVDQFPIVHPRIVLVTPRIEQIRKDIPPIGDLQIVSTVARDLAPLIHYPELPTAHREEHT